MVDLDSLASTRTRPSLEPPVACCWSGDPDTNLEDGLKPASCGTGYMV